MFDGGVPEQFHRFIASPPPPPPPLPPHQPATERSLPFPVSFTSFPQSQHMLNLDSRKIIHHHHHHDIKDVAATTEWIGHTDHDDGEHQHHHHPWCSDEVLALLRFRSTIENWFPEFTWEHTSRKLAEVGFKRSPQECKEKFEEEERKYFNANNNNNTNVHQISNYNTNKGSNYKVFSDVEEFYQHGHDHVSSEVGSRRGNIEEIVQAELLEEDKRDQDQGQVEEASMENNGIGKVRNLEDDAKSSSESSLMMIMRDKKKRKRKKEKETFGVLKGFCEGLVRNMIAQQEEMHKKLLEDMMKEEEEKIAREEVWKKQEIERLNKEVEIRAQEQAMASDRNSNIIKLISKFTDHDHNDVIYKLPISTQTLKPPKSGDIGKRWPKDEVLALINIRRSISNMNDDEHKDGISSSSASASLSSSKAVPLWERISKQMLEIGYKRSAKRCKEKWENINKYFRKTKDVNKKRPLDSRTCPYFHQLTALYSKPSIGTTTTVTATSSVGDLLTRPDGNRVGSSEDANIFAPIHADGVGEKSNVQFSSSVLEFE